MNSTKNCVCTLAKILMQKYLGVPFLYAGLNCIKKQRGCLIHSMSISFCREIKLKMNLKGLLMAKLMKLQFLVQNSL